MPEARHSISITPDDNNDLPVPVKKIIVSGAGNIKVALAKDLDADAFVITVTANTILSDLLIRKVFSSETTATGIRDLY